MDALPMAARRGDLAEVDALLRAGSAVDARDDAGLTALMHAVQSRHATAALVARLLAAGADPNAGCTILGSLPYNALALCLNAGDPEKAALLLQHGADVHYSRAGGYDALIDAVYGHRIEDDPHLLALLGLLLRTGASVQGCTVHQETALRRLSACGRFDAVQLLLDHGADEAQLGWTPLIRTIALGTLADLERALDARPELEARDRLCRTPFLAAIQTGDVAKAHLLLERGADPGARAHCERPALFFAAEGATPAMVAWLLEQGASVEETDQFGYTALRSAVDADHEEAVTLLLAAGADPNSPSGFNSPLAHARQAGITKRLLEAGANPADLGEEGRRALLGLDPEPHECWLAGLTPADFTRWRHRRFGPSNPTPMNNPFWLAMIRAGVPAYAGASRFERRDRMAPPFWCAARFGQSLTFLPDGRIVQIGGEHEDFYDPDFCIYNDVFVHSPDGSIEIYGYPETVFPPTDFHTATFLAGAIWIIGGLGYQGQRGTVTPVFRLDPRKWSMERITVTGDSPGWIDRHRAQAISATEIRIDSERSAVLDIKRRRWC